MVTKVKIVLFLTTSILVTITVGYLYVERDWAATKLHELGAESGLKLSHVQVRGRSNVSKDHLLKALDLELDTPIFKINLEDLHARVSKIGWVRDVIIERRLPGTISITIEERVPVALLQSESLHLLIDETGISIDGADPREFTHLKVVAGDNAASHAAPILAALRTEPDLFSEVWAVSFQSKRRWDVHLKMV